MKLDPERDSSSSSSDDEEAVELVELADDDVEAPRSVLEEESQRQGKNGSTRHGRRAFTSGPVSQRTHARVLGATVIVFLVFAATIIGDFFGTQQRVTLVASATALATNLAALRLPPLCAERADGQVAFPTASVVRLPSGNTLVLAHADGDAAAHVWLRTAGLPVDIGDALVGTSVATLGDNRCPAADDAGARVVNVAVADGTVCVASELAGSEGATSLVLVCLDDADDDGVARPKTVAEPLPSGAHLAALARGTMDGQQLALLLTGGPTNAAPALSIIDRRGRRIRPLAPLPGAFASPSVLSLGVVAGRPGTTQLFAVASEVDDSAGVSRVSAAATTDQGRMWSDTRVTPLFDTLATPYAALDVNHAGEPLVYAAGLDSRMAVAEPPLTHLVSARTCVAADVRAGCNASAVVDACVPDAYALSSACVRVRGPATPPRAAVVITSGLRIGRAASATDLVLVDPRVPLNRPYGTGIYPRSLALVRCPAVLNGTAAAAAAPACGVAVLYEQQHGDGTTRSLNIAVFRVNTRSAARRFVVSDAIGSAMAPVLMVVRPDAIIVAHYDGGARSGFRTVVIPYSISL